MAFPVFRMASKEQDGQQCIAGFWSRFAAFWIDGVIVWGAVMMVVLTARASRVYVPIELSILVFGLFYWVMLTGWWGQTLGKTVCGLKVISNNGGPASVRHAMLRESVGKLISALPFMLGFLCVGFTKRKRAWHDYLARTRVVHHPEKLHRARVILTFMVLITLVWTNPVKWFLDYHAANQMSVDMKNVVTAYSQRDPSSLVDVCSLESDDDLPPFVRWLDENAMDPLEYAVETAANHEITIFGELHWLRDNLAFFNRVIPDLYHRSGVTCVALEACVPQDNAKLERLVTSVHFDHELALEIARNGDAWKNWGWKGYWDVFETVWRVNQGLPEDAVKMRVVGIGIEFDGPSLGLALGKYMDAGPVWEKLGLFRLIDDLARASMVEQVYAANVARETIEKGQRGVLLVGGAHSSIYQPYPHGIETRLFREHARMGFMLHRKYGDQVFQILFHNQEIVNSGRISDFIERIALHRQNRPFGCDMVESPLGKLTDSTGKHFKLQPGLCLSDVAAGYIYLMPIAEQKRCEWVTGYITEQMFVKHKHYYEAKTKSTLNNREEANRVFASYTGW